MKLLYRALNIHMRTVGTLSGDFRFRFGQIWLMLWQNHSCDPNTVAMPCYFNKVDLNLPIVAFFAKRAIKSGEQICIAYWVSSWVPTSVECGEHEMSGVG